MQIIPKLDVVELVSIRDGYSVGGYNCKYELIFDDEEEANKVLVTLIYLTEHREELMDLINKINSGEEKCE